MRRAKPEHHIVRLISFVGSLALEQTRYWSRLRMWPRVSATKERFAGMVSVASKMCKKCNSNWIRIDDQLECGFCVEALFALVKIVTNCLHFAEGTFYKCLGEFEIIKKNFYARSWFYVLCVDFLNMDEGWSDCRSQKNGNILFDAWKNL